MNELESTALIIAPRFVVAPVTISAGIIADKDLAIAKEILLGKVSNAAENDRAVRAQAEMKLVRNKLEAARKQAKAPYIDMGRSIDQAAQTHIEELDREIGRLESLTVPWGQAERRRIAEELERQQEELRRIEREKQAEIARIVREQREREAEACRIQAEADRQVRLAQEAADKAAREATSKAQREAAQASQQEAARLAEENRLANLRLAEVQKQEAITVAATVERIEEQAGNASYLSSRPIQADTARGQKLARDWDIVVTDPYTLAKFHPSCVKITPLVGEIKNCLREGIVVKGITATETVNTSVRAKRERPSIET